MDKTIQKLITQEVRRQNETLDLIPSENTVSKDVLKALGSELTNKYAEGYPAARYYGGNEIVDQVETIAQERALKAFKLAPAHWHVNVQPYSGSPANLAIYLALVPPGEKIMGMELAMGGHLTHGHTVSATGKFWKPVRYGVDKETEMLDYGAIAALARAEKPRIIVAGYTAYPQTIDFKKFRKIADEVNAYLMIDMSHFAGLVAGEVYPSPFPYADVVMTTTHKTLRGPRGAMIFVNKKSKIAAAQKVVDKNGMQKDFDIARAIDRAVFPGLQGGPHMNQIAAAAVALEEAAKPAYKKYAAQVVKNAAALSEELKKMGWRMVSGGTSTHLILFDVAARGIFGKEASITLEKNGIIANMNTIPYDTQPPVDPSGIRIGTPTLTTRGMKEKEMKEVARLITAALIEKENVKKEVIALCKKFPIK
jgi:glycine hydroxymethyltransferase